MIIYLLNTCLISFDEVCVLKTTKASCFFSRAANRQSIGGEGSRLLIEDDKIEKQRHPAYGARKRSLVPVAVALPELSRLFSTHVLEKLI